MRIGLTFSAVAFGCALCSAQAQAQSRIAVSIIGNVVGALAGAAVDAALRPDYRAYDAAPVEPDFQSYTRYPAAPSYGYGLPAGDRSGVLYNKPCSTFDAATGRLLPCGTAIAYDAPVHAASEVVVTRPARRHHHHHHRRHRPIYK